MKILITGSTGFVGRAVVRDLKLRGHGIVRAVRQCESDAIVVESIDDQVVWGAALQGCDVVVHLAARVHVMDDTESNSLGEFRKVNVGGTLNIARQAAQAGVRRFIFVSSVKVNGEDTATGRPFTAEDIPRPRDPYGVSKMEAESALRALAGRSGMDIVIIRPPLIYGPGVRANFAALIRVVAQGVPLPLSAIGNKRSLLAIDNLVDLIAVCIDHPNAANQVFMVSDGEDISTPDLIRRLAKAMNRPARVFYVPLWLLQLGAKLTGKSRAMQRLCGNLQVDISKTRDMLDWKPPIGVDEGLRRAVVQWRQ